MATGVDIVDVGRVARILQRRPAFVRRYFGDREQRWPAPVHAQWYASCLAAKEAFVKALGTGVLGAVPLREIEIVVDSGRTTLLPGPSAEAVMRAQGLERVWVSCTCDRTRAMAWVLLTSRPTV